MSEESPKKLDGLMVKYAFDGDECQIHGYHLEDGGVLWKFIRAGHEYPLSLSKQGMDAMLAIWHQLTWGKGSQVQMKFQDE